MDDAIMKLSLAVDEHHWWYRGRREIIRSELDKLPLAAAARVLDAGCGSGRTLEELTRYGEVYGIELNQDAAAHARARGRGEVRVGRLEELPWAAHFFDLVTCLDVLEHTADDRLTLRELRRVTKPGGWLLVTVPAYQGLWSTHDEANHHFRRYGRRTLSTAAVQAGWKVQRITSFNSVLLAPAAAVRVALRQRRGASPSPAFDPGLRLGPAWLNRALEQPLRAEARWLRSGWTLPAGLSLLALLANPPPTRE